MVLNAVVDSFLPQSEKCGTEKVNLYHLQQKQAFFTKTVNLCRMFMNVISAV